MISELADALRAEGGVLAELVDGHHGAAPTVTDAPQVAAAGPRAAGRERDYELMLEMILEGSLLHYGAPRVVRTDDRDLALLLGDQLYALGLVRLTALDDVEAVRVLADLISRLAQAHAEGDPSRATEIWQAGAKSIGWGS
jgi:hypothetical protein